MSELNQPPSTSRWARMSKSLAFWALLIIIPLIVIQLVSAAAEPADVGGVAFVAHVGGFVAGMALIGLFKRRDVALLDRGRRR